MAAGEGAGEARRRKRELSDALPSYDGADGGVAGAEALPASPRATKLPRAALVAAAS
jgi:hypothetical protein